MPIIPTLERLRQDYCKSLVILTYIVSSRLSRVTWGNTISPSAAEEDGQKSLLSKG